MRPSNRECTVQTRDARTKLLGFVGVSRMIEGSDERDASRGESAELLENRSTNQVYVRIRANVDAARVLEQRKARFPTLGAREGEGAIDSKAGRALFLQVTAV